MSGHRICGCSLEARLASAANENCPIHANLELIVLRLQRSIMEGVLKRAKEKLSIYNKQTGGVYSDGEALQFLMKDIDAALPIPAAQAPAQGCVICGQPPIGIGLYATVCKVCLEKAMATQDKVIFEWSMNNDRRGWL